LKLFGEARAANINQHLQKLMPKDHVRDEMRKKFNFNILVAPHINSLEIIASSLQEES
jgi:hypothetical protein